jgi:penicillin-binding protein 2
MKLSCVWFVGFALAGTGTGWAFDAPHTLHHPKASEPHLSGTHHSARHKAAAAQGRKPAAKSAASAKPVAKSSGRAAAVPAHASANSKSQAQAAPKAGLRRASLHARRHHYYERFTASSFATGTIGEGDVTAGEDPVVRQAAIDALDGMNGTAVVIDPSSGRILAMVNQKLALSPGAEPCSTIKLSVALAALSEGLVTRDTPVSLGGFRMNMTDAIAKSNNLYFEELGRELGFDRVRHYATQENVVKK